MSKKKIIQLIAVVMVVMIATMCLTSCKLFTENEERAYNETLYTITGADGIVLELTRAEVLSMYSTYASYYIQYGGYTAEEVMDMVIESRIKSKYLTTVAMSYLSNKDKTSADRYAALVGKGAKNNPVDVLTVAEYYAAILSVNDSISETLEGYVEDIIQDEYQADVKALKNTDVKEIKFADETLEYFGDGDFYVDQGIDKSMVKFVVVYDDNSESEATIVPDSMYTTEYDSDEAATDSEIVISFDEIVTVDGEETEEAHTATFTYDVLEPRATRTVDEDEDVDAIELEGGVKVNRYDTDVPVVAKIDPSAEYEAAKAEGDTLKTEAYRQLVNNLESNYTSMDRLYDSAFESAVLSALQAEVKKKAGDVTEQEIKDQFEYLYNKSKADYATLDSQEDKQEEFGDNISDGMEDVYYYPAIDNISGYYYVYQILFKFSDEQADWLESQINDADETRATELYEYMKDYIEVQESNPDYDADYDCPYHEEGNHNEKCTYLEDHPDATQEEADECCPSVAYKTKKVMFTDVYAELQTKLAEASTPEEKLEIFLEYVYRFNDDTGIMNSSAGYVIAPEDNVDPNSFYEAFTGLARDVFAYKAEVGNAFVSDGELGYAFTPYGVHIIMVSMTPFDGLASGVALDLADDTAVDNYLDRVININGETLRETIAASLKSDKESRAYSDFTSANIPTDLVDIEEEEYNKDFIKVNKSAVKDLYEEYIGD